MKESTAHIRSYCNSVEQTFNPRLLKDIPLGEPQQQIPEALLAAAFLKLKAACDHIDDLEQRLK